LLLLPGGGRLGCLKEYDDCDLFCGGDGGGGGCCWWLMKKNEAPNTITTNY